ncbi:leucine-rich repeat-containing protein 2 isoform X1 [Sinocyclocheilus grahami]|uniref:leucine-rich repeat-containing protein 2 isoform X1 n=1 Tax=Sinocyclocheilus grahami TaxID=75366 RepID=UPI0007ACBC8C|nr:PREDICTED: leucine-rich repeat-containing protein 2 isoform X1 [Sinocyclocheilus grahami]
MKAERIGVDIPVYDLSLIRDLWEGRVKKHKQRQKKEEERISQSALARVNQQWQYRIACRKLKSAEVAALQCYLERSALREIHLLPTDNKDNDADNKKFIFELNGKKWMKLPEELQYMTYLKEWHIHGTRIPEIPTYIEAFVDLQVLDVPKNGLTRLPTEIGSQKSNANVSSFTGKLINLKELNVNYNKLLSIPPELGECEHLERLEMTANRNLAELPFELSNLKKLTHLDVAENQFASIPVCVLRMESLKCLDISNNRLKDLPEDIDRLESLEMLFLHKNNVRYVPMTVTNLIHLRMLVISADELYSIPSQLVDNPNIKLIRLYDNPINTDNEDMNEIDAEAQDERDKEFMKTYIETLQDRDTQPSYTTKVSLSCLL